MIEWPPPMLNSMKAHKVRVWMSKNIANNIAFYRKTAGLTQTQLAELLGKKQPQVARWERTNYGRHTLNSLVLIATALNVQVEDLLTHKEEE